MKSQFDAILANFMDKKDDMLLSKNPNVNIKAPFEMEELDERDQSPVKSQNLEQPAEINLTPSSQQSWK